MSKADDLQSAINDLALGAAQTARDPKITITLRQYEQRLVEAAIEFAQASCVHGTSCQACQILHDVQTKIDDAGAPKE